MNRTPGMSEITQAELIAHIEDENFLRVYGNPVWIRSNDGTHDCVLDHPSVHFQLFHIVWMHDDVQLLLHRLEQYDYTGYLDAASRTAGTGSDEHEQYQN